MRLTLRTLLAYLDNTLDSEDAEALRQKLEQSGFATQLVQRIRASLTDPTLSAPAPDSVHPIEEPNMMSNFLDSTLPPEQIAELEKACLESPPHLAEAAACHQILTMVLGKPAEVSDELRTRIFAMVDLGGKIMIGEPAADATSSRSAIAGEIGPRYSGIDMGSAGKDNATSTEPPPVESHAQEISGPSYEQNSVEGGVPPVGVDDSGVFQAASKLSEQSHQFAETGTAMDDADLASSAKPFHQIEPADLVSKKTPSFRIAPWLISVALVGLLLFAIVQIFAPLIAPKLAQQDEEKLSESFPVLPKISKENADEDSGEPGSKQPNESSESPAPSEQEDKSGASDPEKPSDDPAEAAVAADKDAEPLQPEDGQEQSSEQMPKEADAVNGASESGDAMASEEMSEATVGPAEKIASLPDATGVESPEEKNPAMESVSPDATSDPGMEPGPGPGVIAAKLISKNALVAQRQGDGDWQLMPAEAEASTNSLIACGPEYRVEFLVASPPDVIMTAMGPAEFRWMEGDETVNIRVRYGKGIVKLASSGEGVNLAVGLATLNIAAESENAILGFNIRHFCELGDDPLIPENHRTALDLIAVEGDFSVSGFRNDVSLVGGSLATYDLNAKDDDDATLVTLDNLPDWVDSETDTGSLESDAAADLLELVRSDGSASLILSLRSALQFRRNEVAALGGKTMLALGDPTAYFGLDGLFTNPSQRLYWSSHLDAVRNMMDRSVTDATAVRAAISGSTEGVDDADGDTIFRLLRGYSQDQLKTGGDAELVQDLESASVPVRVLASESLRDISGTTLFFRPEEEVVSRRDEVVKKWKVRLRKESIRYPESE